MYVQAGKSFLIAAFMINLKCARLSQVPCKLQLNNYLIVGICT